MTSGQAWRRTADGVAAIELADVAPGEGRVVVAVEAAAVEPWPATPLGRVPGVAAVGRVTAVGAAADEWLGARVLVPSSAPCGECDRCRRGGAVLCPTGATHGVDGPGALATHMTAAARWLCRLDGALALPGPAAAALGGELAVAYALYARAGIGPREPTIIWGRGALARLCMAVLAAKAAPAVLATDDPALAGATTIGLDPAAADAALRDHGARPRKVLVADASLLPAALAAAGPRATVVVATGPGRPAAPAMPLDALAQEVTIAGVAGCHPDLVPELAALAVRGDLDLASLVEVVTVDALAGRLAARPSPTTLVVALPA